MDQDLKVVLLFIVFVLTWVLVPVLPAWITYRITPDQDVQLTGPVGAPGQLRRVRATRAFAAYLVVFSLTSVFIARAGNQIIGHALDVETWKVIGDVQAIDANGQPTATPNLEHLGVRTTPDLRDLPPDGPIALPVSFRTTEYPTIYLAVPDWGGGRIMLSDRSSFNIDQLKREIRLKTHIILREAPRTSFVLGGTK